MTESLYTATVPCYEMTHGVSCRSATEEGWVRSHDSPCGFMSEKVALGQVCLRVLRFIMSAIQPVIYIRSSIYHRPYANNRAAQNAAHAR